MRFKPETRKALILRCAIDCAIKIGYHAITRKMVAEKANISYSLVNNYFSSLPRLKRAIMRFAIENKMLGIIAQGLVLKDKEALKAPIELKQTALKNLVK